MLKQIVLLVITLMVSITAQKVNDRRIIEAECKKRNKVPLYNLMSNIYNPYIAASNLIRFRKIHVNGWSSIRSAKPVLRNATTEFTIKMLNTNYFMIGCGLKSDHLLSTQFFGQIPNTVGFHPPYGTLYLSSVAIPYNVVANVGDHIKIKIDLHQDAQYVEFFINDLSMGIAFGGLGDWEQIYFGVSIHSIENSFEIVNHKVTL